MIGVAYEERSQYTRMRNQPHRDRSGMRGSAAATDTALNDEWRQSDRSDWLQQGNRSSHCECTLQEVRRRSLPHVH